MATQNDATGNAEPTGSSPENPTDATAELEKLTGTEEVAGETQTVAEAAGAEADGGEPAADEKPKGEEKPEGEEHRSGRAEQRIAELSKARKEQEEARAAAESKAQELEAKAAHEIGLHPDYVSTEESKLIQEANALEKREQFLIENWEGYEDPKDPAKSKTGTEIRAEYAQIHRRALATAAKANAVYEERLKQQTADMLAGRKARLEREALAKRALGKPAAEKPQARTMAPPAAAAGKAIGAPGAKQGMNEERFIKAGADKAAAARELAELAGGD